MNRLLLRQQCLSIQQPAASGQSEWSRRIFGFISDSSGTPIACARFSSFLHGAPDPVRHDGFACCCLLCAVAMLLEIISVSSCASCRSASTLRLRSIRAAKSSQTRDSFSSFSAILSLWTKSAALSASDASA